MTIPIFTALIVAAGDGVRVKESGPPKQYKKISEHTLLHNTITNVIAPYACAIKVVIKREHEALYKDTVLSLPEAIRQFLLEPAFGGARRQDSVRLGLQSLKSTNPDFVIIHDSCRPFAAVFPVDKLLSYMDDCVGVVPTIPLSETVSVVRNGVIVDTVQREGTYIVQTPQIFRYKEILECHEKVYKLSPEVSFTDDSSIALHCNRQVATMCGNMNNFKITTANDIVRATAYLSGL